MGYYSEYINKSLSFETLQKLRKQQLEKIANIRGRKNLVYASDLTKARLPISIDYSDLLPFQDQISFVETKDIDVIIETPGGIGTIVEDLVTMLRNKYQSVGVIIPGTAKSAGTIFTMAGDEIWMSPNSSLGPIDAQIQTTNGKQYSADALLDGLNNIKQEVVNTGKLNPTYIPMLQNLSPGEIEHCRNAQAFSRDLVTKWLKTYKFKFWDHHSDKSPVTEDDKEKRANSIASKLCKHSDWLSHGKSIHLSDLRGMKLKVDDYTEIPELKEAIERYYALLRITFSMTNTFKIYETIDSQIYVADNPIPVPSQANTSEGNRNDLDRITANIVCPSCKKELKVQMDFKPSLPVIPEHIKYPANDMLACPSCSAQINIAKLRLQIESQFKKNVLR